MRMTRQMVLAIVFAVVPSVALATHIPGSGEKVQYDGALTPGVASTGSPRQARKKRRFSLGIEVIVSLSSVGVKNAVAPRTPAIAGPLRIERL